MKQAFHCKYSQKDLEETLPNKVNKKWTNHDQKVWTILLELIISPSWSHLNITLITFEKQTRLPIKQIKSK